MRGEGQAVVRAQRQRQAEFAKGRSKIGSTPSRVGATTMVQISFQGIGKSPSRPF